MEYGIAPLYDLLLFPFVRRLRRRILEIALERGYRSVVDLCCGTGNQLKLLRRHGFRVAGADLSERMLAVSRRGRYAVDCRLEDAAHTSFPDASFDAAAITFALHEKEAESARAILREMLRLVPSGGELLVADYHFGEGGSRAIARLIEVIERIAGGEHYRNFRSYRSAGGIAPLLADLPLQQLKSETLGGKTVGIWIYRKE
jgi:demethylmenaquinone methyltransferase/2-methoxy-6-polyprenyl-1,4-benzoquinol methylase